MKEEIGLQKSLIEQILDEMSKSIEKKDQFDSLTVGKLKRLVAKGDIMDVSKVTEAISPNSKENDENS